jgi:predicted DNA-binding ribbon-helix-helix protein
MMQKYSVSIRGHATSISLEPEFWNALCALATAQNKAVAQLIAEIDASRSRTSGGLSSAIRLHILNEMHQRLTPPPE